jgi:hypothetical protein
MHETGLNVWRVLEIPSTAMVIDGMDSSTDPESRDGWESVLEMELSVHTNLIASALSDDGRWHVASDLYEAKLFELSKTVSLCSWKYAQFGIRSISNQGNQASARRHDDQRQGRKTQKQ